MLRFNARALAAPLLLSVLISTPVLAIYGTTEKKESFHAKALLSATNGILTVQIENSSTNDLGDFTVRTGASHPHPNQDVLFPVGTSYITLRDVTSQEVWANNGSGGGNIGAGFTFHNMNVAPGAPGVVTALGTTGFRTVWTLPSWTVQQDVIINGSSLADTNVQQTVTVTNTSGAPRQYGVRFMWDWEIAGNDASLFRTRNPDSAFTSTFTTFNGPTFQLYEEVDSATSPTFSVFGTTTGGPLSPAPTTPDQLRYSSWGTSFSNGWDFANTGGNSDSSTVYYWGFNAPLTLAAGASASYTQYLTTQLSAAGGGGAPVQPVVPTLSTWGMLMLIGLVAAFAVWSARRRTH
jgi:hypothetical protein